MSVDPNPYCPPNAQAPQPVEVLPKKPTSVRIAIGLLWLVIPLEFLSRFGVSAIGSVTVIAAAVMVFGLVVAIIHGRAWSRVAFVGLFALHLLEITLAASEAGYFQLTRGDLILCGIELLALALLLAPPSSKWFRTNSST